jgi:Ca2+-binding EF-hand superfamily protein
MLLGLAPKAMDSLLLEKLYSAFDCDQDGVISSSDFADTLRGVDSEAILRIRSRLSKKHSHEKLC